MNLETILKSNPFTEELVAQWKGQRDSMIELCNVKGVYVAIGRKY